VDKVAVRFSCFLPNTHWNSVCFVVEILCFIGTVIFFFLFQKHDRKGICSDLSARLLEEYDLFKKGVGVGGKNDVW
jgi:hypothetical protein